MQTIQIIKKNKIRLKSINYNAARDFLSIIDNNYPLRNTLYTATSLYLIALLDMILFFSLSVYHVYSCSGLALSYFPHQRARELFLSTKKVIGKRSRVQWCDVGSKKKKGGRLSRKFGIRGRELFLLI